MELRGGRSGFDFSAALPFRFRFPPFSVDAVVVAVAAAAVVVAVAASSVAVAAVAAVVAAVAAC